MAHFRQTPSQTVGPYFAYGLTGPQYGYPHTAVADGRVATPDADGERIRIEGRVFDGDGKPIADALIEIWQADGRGRYAGMAGDAAGSNSRFKGFGRCGTGADPDSTFMFDTVKPGPVDPGQAPHINVIVQMRGLLTHLFTRIYFSDETAANAADPVLALVPAERRGTLVAERRSEASGVVYRFDIHMQGADETVFFDA